MESRTPNIIELRHFVWSNVFLHILSFLADMCGVAPIASLNRSSLRCLMLPGTWAGSHQDIRGSRRTSTLRYFQYIEMIVSLARCIVVDPWQFLFVCYWHRPFTMIWTPYWFGLLPANIIGVLSTDAWLTVNRNFVLHVSEDVCMFKARVQVEFDANPPGEVWLVLSTVQNGFDIQDAMAGFVDTDRIVHSCRLHIDRRGQICGVDWYFNAVCVAASVVPLPVVPLERDEYRYHILSLSWNRYIIKAYASGVFLDQQLFGARAAAPPVANSVFFAVGFASNALRNARVRARPMPVHYAHAFRSVACVFCEEPIFEAIGICQQCRRPFCFQHGGGVQANSRIACVRCRARRQLAIHDVV